MTSAGRHPLGVRVVQPQRGLAAERRLVSIAKQEIAGMNSRGVVPLLLNLGAGSSTVIETQLSEAGARFLVDRVDLELTVVRHTSVREQWAGNIEDLSAIASDSYDLVFANYVMEHVQHVRAAVAEMARVARPGAALVLTLANPRAPEFRVAARSPRRLQQVFHPGGFETHYAYRSVSELAHHLHAAGLHPELIEYSSAIGPYLNNVSRLAGRLGDAYDRAVARRQARCLCGHVLIAARKG